MTGNELHRTAVDGNGNYNVGQKQKIQDGDKTEDTSPPSQGRAGESRLIMTANMQRRATTLVCHTGFWGVFKDGYDFLGILANAT